MLEKILAVALAWFPDVELDSYVIEALPDCMTIKLANNYSLTFPITSLEMPVEELVEIYMGIKKRTEQKAEAKRLKIEETNRQLEITRKRENARIEFLLSKEGSELCTPLEGETKNDTFDRISDYLVNKGLLLPQEYDKLKSVSESKRNGTYVPDSKANSVSKAETNNEVSSTPS